MVFQSTAEKEKNSTISRGGKGKRSRIRMAPNLQNITEAARNVTMSSNFWRKVILISIPFPSKVWGENEDLQKSISLAPLLRKLTGECVPPKQGVKPRIQETEKRRVCRMDWLKTSRWQLCLESDMSRMKHITSFQEGHLQEVKIDGLPNLSISRENLNSLGRIWIK